jgi:hypothetical protein
VIRLKEITIAAVGDILINGAISLSVKQPSANQYDFDSIYQKKEPITGFPRFNGPEQLAATLKRNGEQPFLEALIGRNTIKQFLANVFL